MPRFDFIDGGTDSEQEQVRLLIQSVFEHGVAALDVTTPEEIRRGTAFTALTAPSSDGFAPKQATKTAPGRAVDRRNRRVALATVITTAAAAVVLLALLLPSQPATEHPGSPPWRLVSSIGPAAQEFGSTGSSPAVESNQSLDGISCPTSTVCYSTVQTEVTSPINGSLFHKMTGGTIAPGSTATYPLTTGVYVSEDSGASWRDLTLPSGVSLNTRLTCPTATTCMAGAQVGQPNGWDNVRQQLFIITHDSGASWSKLQVPMQTVMGIDPALDPSIAGLTGFLTQLTCFSAQTCFAFGEVPSDQPIASLSGSDLSQEAQISEATVSRTVFMRTDDGGKSWSTFVFPWAPEPDGAPGASNAEAAMFSCPSEESCTGFATVVANVSGTASNSLTSPFSTLIWHSDDGGSSWSSFWPADETQLQALHVYPNVSCSDALHCLAEVAPSGNPTRGIGIIRTSDGGSTWQLTPVLNGQNGELWTLTCPTTDDCWGVGGTLVGTIVTPGAGFILATRDGGQTWTQVPLPGGLTMVEGISCPTTAACYAIGGSQTSVSGPLGGVEVLTNGPGPAG